SMANLATSYFVVGRQAESLRLREETLALCRVELGPDHPITLLIMTSVADSYGSARRYAESLELRHEILALSKAKLGSDHPNTLQCMRLLALAQCELGVSLVHQAKFTEAEPLLLQSYAATKKDPHCFNKMHLYDLLEALAQLYEATGRKESAAP